MDYVPGYIGLKITNVPSWANCISIMRKYSSSSIAEIRNCIDQNAYILLSPSINTSGIKKIRKCYDELLKNNISAEIYELLTLFAKKLSIYIICGNYFAITNKKV